MKIVTISENEEFLLNLLSAVQKEDVILQTPSGQQFVVFPLENWQGFEVGDSDDFAREAENTTANRDLMAFLAARKSGQKRISLDEVKKNLGLDKDSV